MKIQHQSYIIPFPISSTITGSQNQCLHQYKPHEWAKSVFKSQWRNHSKAFTAAHKINHNHKEITSQNVYFVDTREYAWQL